jgi:hypothetical protein
MDIGICRSPEQPESLELNLYQLGSRKWKEQVGAQSTRLSAGGVADEWVTQLLRQGDAKVFKKYSQMKLQMKREALVKMNRQANDAVGFWHSHDSVKYLAQFWLSPPPTRIRSKVGRCFRMNKAFTVGA